MSEANHTVGTADEFGRALATAGDDAVIRLERHTSIDVTDRDLPNLPPGVRLVAGTDADDRPAATLRDETCESGETLEAAGGADVRGVTFYGPEANPIDLDRSLERSGLFLHGPEATVSGCAFHGWPVAGVAVGSKATETEARITDCTVRDNLMGGYGYGVLQYNGSAEIAGCRFDFNRHSIASFGSPTCYYHAHDNAVGPHTRSHAFDVHGREVDGRVVAGRGFRIEGNTFEFTRDLDGDPQEAVAVRGVPLDRGYAHDNRFTHARPPEAPGGQGDAIRQETVDDWTNLEVYDNEYGYVG